MKNLPALLEQLPFFVSVCDTKGTLVWTNRVIYGLNHEILGQPSDTHIAEADRPIWWACFRRVVHFREIVDYEVKVIVPEPPGWAKLGGRLSPYVKQDRVQNVVAVAHDQTLRDVPNPLARFVLSPLGKKVISFLLRVGSAKGPTIGRHVGEVSSNGQASPKLRAVLAEKVMRGILHHVEGGYRISESFAPFATVLAAL